MSKWVSVEPVVYPQPIDAVSTTQQAPLGTIIQAKDVAATNYGGGEFIYLKGVANTVLGSVVTYNMDDGSTALLVADAIGPVAVAMADLVADTYGWYQISGKAVVKAATVVNDARVWASSSAGIVDDSTSDGNMVHIAKFASADGTPAAGLAECEIHRPYVDDITSND